MVIRAGREWGAELLFVLGRRDRKCFDFEEVHFATEQVDWREIVGLIVSNRPTSARN